MHENNAIEHEQEKKGGLKFSLIMATLNRFNKPKLFLRSLCNQTYKNFELIVVDQNQGNKLKAALKPFYGSGFQILHLRSKPGLSRARNVGLDYASGDVVAFPDDDCCYPAVLLEWVNDWLQKHPDYDGISGRSVLPAKGALDQLCPDPGGGCFDLNKKISGKIDSVGKFDTKAGQITRYNIWKRTTSISLFLRRTEITESLRFDSDLGLGSDTGYGCAEDIDFPLRAMLRGAQLYYDPHLCVVHPDTRKEYDEKDIQQAELFGAGKGYVLRKHKYPLWFIIIRLLAPLYYTMRYLIPQYSRARFHLSVFRGRIRGLRG
ncbi:MAG: glycosyltransferase family 2 protein [candidate division Zixibacteria bacterium]|nr:glycosyltransferase family 2 protein [candidate division Zixibacteria bacterium]